MLSHNIVQTCTIHLIRNTFRLTSKRDSDAIKRAVKPTGEGTPFPTDPRV